VYSLSEAKASGLAREDERDWQNVEKTAADSLPDNTKLDARL
jgi:hypothetical protein